MQVAPEEQIYRVLERHPGALEVLAQQGIDCCCGTFRTLREGAAEAGVDLEALLAALRQLS